MDKIKRKMNKKGFTLAEMLIVVAIIAVLVAVSIPIFTSRLERAREATDIANMRAAKAAAVAAYLDHDDILELDATGDTKKVYYDAEDGELVAAKPTPGYGQGTKINAETAYGDYDSNKSYDGLSIYIIVTKETGAMDIDWD